MPQLTVITSEASRAIPFAPGLSVREILEGAGIGVRSGCRGDGACGLCLVQLAAGDVPPTTATERLILPREKLAGNVRLACQLRPENDLGLRVIDPPPKSRWRDLAPETLPGPPAGLASAAGAAPVGGALGLAIDLGTTQISFSLWDLPPGRRRSSRVGPNPQSDYGADVVTRLLAAGESAQHARRLARLPWEAVADALQELGARDGVRPAAIDRVAIVGNTAMLALLTEADPRSLLQPRNGSRPLEHSGPNSSSWVRELGLQPRAVVDVVPPLAGFVGSDLLAGVVATRLTARPGALLIDFGTNSEMALWDGSTLWVSSAAGGPAFESGGIRCGRPAEPGAIYRCRAAPDSGGLQFDTLGGGEARGLCGSGLVDLIACLRDCGELSRTGVFTRPEQPDGYVVRRQDPVIRLTKGDVDIVQRAKAGIAVGICALLARAHLTVAELSRVCVGGVFGQNLNVRHAQRIGLLPDVPPERIQLCGNTALAGCERLLLSTEAAAELAALRPRAMIVNLAEAPDFDALFLENLYLQPLRADQP
jgi:uncharacterized 2Fe-2S/4Fe-4S cluster protein (DUF4445 family)